MEEKNIGLLFWGDVGTGKSFLAGCIANALIDQGISCCMTSIARISNAMNGLFSEDKNRYLNSLNEYRLLIIDDLGSERNTEYSLEQVYDVIDSRYVSGKPLIITTNLTVEELNNSEDRQRKRINSRVLEMCIPIKVNDRNLRKEKTSARFQEMKTFLLTEQSA